MNINLPIQWKAKQFNDHRGYLSPIVFPFVAQFYQANIVCTKAGFIRGLHWQKAPFQQGKLITVLEGKIQDVIIDLYTEQMYEYELNVGDSLWIPKFFAHGFCSLDESKVIYFIDSEYVPSAEMGVTPLCPELKIDWRVDIPDCNERDKTRPVWSKRFGADHGLQEIRNG